MSSERRSKNFTDPLIRAAIYTFLLVELLVIGFILWGPNARECGSIVDRLKMVNPRDWRCEPIIWIALFLNQLENTGASEETSRNFMRLADACRARGESYRARQACLRSVAIDEELAKASGHGNDNGTYDRERLVTDLLTTSDLESDIGNAESALKLTCRALQLSNENATLLPSLSTRLRLAKQLAFLYAKLGDTEKSMQYLAQQKKLESIGINRLKKFDAAETAILRNNSASSNYRRSCNSLLRAMHTIAWQLVHDGRPNEAEPYLRKTIEVELKAIERSFGGTETPGAMSLIGRIQWQRGDLMLADKTYAQLTSAMDQSTPRKDLVTLKLYLKEFADLKEDMGRSAEARALRDKARSM